MYKKPTTEFSFSKPAIYKIMVDGELSSDWSDQLNGMEIKVNKNAGHKPTSILIGKLSDQAALSGVLNALYDLHLTILCVKIIDDANSESNDLI